MNSITGLTAQQLRQAADIKEKLDALQNQLNQILGSEVSAPAGTAEKPKKRRMSAAGRRAIAAGARARWAAIKAKRAKPAKKARRKMSAAAKAKMAALMKARWAKVKKAGKSRL
jgi:hypothetical protein